MAEKNVVFKSPTEDRDYKYILVVYDRPASMLGPTHDMYMVDSVIWDKDTGLEAYRNGEILARFHKDFPWFMVAKTEAEFQDDEAGMIVEVVKTETPERGYL